MNSLNFHPSQNPSIFINYYSEKTMKQLFFGVILTLILLFSFALKSKSQSAVKDVTEQSVHEFMDAWHLAAAQADAKTFFGSMAEEGVYLGTDASERWLTAEFEEWAKPYFDKGKAWEFKAIERNIAFGPDKKIAWFDEKLDTWMGVCRGSGVLMKDSNQDWKIHQYNLAVTVPNDNIQEFLKIATQVEE